MSHFYFQSVSGQWARGSSGLLLASLVFSSVFNLGCSQSDPDPTDGNTHAAAETNGAETNVAEANGAETNDPGTSSPDATENDADEGATDTAATSDAVLPSDPVNQPTSSATGHSGSAQPQLDSQPSSSATGTATPATPSSAPPSNTRPGDDSPAASATTVTSSPDAGSPTTVPTAVPSTDATADEGESEDCPTGRCPTPLPADLPVASCEPELGGIASAQDFTLNTDTGEIDHHLLLLVLGDVIRRINRYTTSGDADHQHEVILGDAELDALLVGSDVQVKTGTPLNAATGHTHTVLITACPAPEATP